MADVGKRELKARCYYFSVAILRFTSSTDIKWMHRSIVDQLIRSSTSVGANVVEAKSASSRQDFIRFYEYALKSANETKYWLCLLRDGVGINGTVLSPHLQEIEEISKILASSILKLKRK